MPRMSPCLVGKGAEWKYLRLLPPSECDCGPYRCSEGGLVLHATAGLSSGSDGWGEVVRVVGRRVIHSPLSFWLEC